MNVYISYVVKEEFVYIAFVSLCLLCVWGSMLTPMYVVYYSFLFFYRQVFVCVQLCGFHYSIIALVQLKPYMLHTWKFDLLFLLRRG